VPIENFINVRSCEINKPYFIVNMLNPSIISKQQLNIWTAKIIAFNTFLPCNPATSSDSSYFFPELCSCKLWHVSVNMIVRIAAQTLQLIAHELIPLLSSLMKTAPSFGLVLAMVGVAITNLYALPKLFTRNTIAVMSIDTWTATVVPAMVESYCRGFSVFA
jgi:hypothetical protein